MTQPDEHGNVERREGLDRCYCGCKYWEHDRCIDCGGSDVDEDPDGRVAREVEAEIAETIGAPKGGDTMSTSSYYNMLGPDPVGDLAALAVECIGSARIEEEIEGDPARAANRLAEAQVYATLALAEATRLDRG